MVVKETILVRDIHGYAKINSKLWFGGNQSSISSTLLFLNGRVESLHPEYLIHELRVLKSTFLYDKNK